MRLCRQAFPLGIAHLRQRPADGAPAVRYLGSAVVRSWSLDTVFTATGRSRGAWLELRAPGGHHSGWLHRRELQ